MIRMVWNRIIHRKAAALTLLFALVSLYVLIPYAFHQSREVKATVNDTIEQYGRGSYDILVRPPSSRTQIEKTFGMVEDNYIVDSAGGISIKAWRDMQANPDIEVAAPVASLGYYRGMRLSIALPVLDQSTRFTFQFFTSNGKEKFPITDQGTLTFFKKIKPGFIQYLTGIQQQELVSSYMDIIMPPSYYPMVAIDAKSEERLTGIDFPAKFKHAHYSENFKSMLKNFGNLPVVKVLQRDDLPIPVYLKLKMDTVDLNLKHYLHELGLNEDNWIMQGGNSDHFDSVLKEVKSEKALATRTTWIDLSNFLHPFNGTALELNSQLQPSVSSQHLGAMDTSVYYTASKLTYKNLEGMPRVEIVKEGSPPSYKLIEKHDIGDLHKLPFLVYQIGTFSAKSQTKSKLAASPLGIYGDLKAKTVDGETLTPTILPGSFIASPASGVTTMKAAKLLKGKNPIDAIRVKVAGIDSYNKAAQRKIEKVATHLLKKGYEVDVVAGSSFKKMIFDVEGIGKVIDQWTTLGIAQELTSTWNVLTVLTSILFITFGILWLVVRLTFEKNTWAGENDILSTIGWRQSRINMRNCIEHYFLITAALIVSIVVLFFGNATAGMYWISIGLWAFAVAMSTYLVNQKKITKVSTRPYKYFPAIFHQMRIIFPSMLILILSTVLTSLQIASMAEAFQEASLTRMGAYTNNVTFWVQSSIVFQLSFWPLSA
ncbi:MAG TPA: hypothetical protein VFK44_08045 [Bacillales bacterium]|nr:hypothetical protein [Bacillales bacterium]